MEVKKKKSNHIFYGQVPGTFLVPRPGIRPVPPALESDVLTAGPPGRSLSRLLKLWRCNSHTLTTHSVVRFSPPSRAYSLTYLQMDTSLKTSNYIYLMAMKKNLKLCLGHNKVIIMFHEPLTSVKSNEEECYRIIRK